jgi:drug/metabolite transporter (DMT)-like permease
MDAILIFLTSFGTAYLAGKLTRRGPFSLADCAASLAGGFIALGMAHFFGTANGEWGLGLPLLLACALPLGLGSLQQRSLLR